MWLSEIFASPETLDFDGTQILCEFLSGVGWPALDAAAAIHCLPNHCSQDGGDPGSSTSGFPWSESGDKIYQLHISFLSRLSNGVPKFFIFIMSQEDSNEKYTFELVTIQRMEIHVLASLNWRMQAVTPFSYINYFVDKFTEGKPLSCGFISRCTEIILGTLEGRSDYFMNELVMPTFSIQ